MLKNLVKECIELLIQKDAKNKFLYNNFTVLGLRLLISYREYIYYCSEKKLEFRFSYFKTAEGEKYEKFKNLLDSLLLFASINDLNFTQIFIGGNDSKLVDPLTLMNLMLEDLESVTLTENSEYEKVLNSVINLCVDTPCYFEIEKILQKRILDLKKIK